MDCVTLPDSRDSLKGHSRNSLVVQWLGFHILTAKGLGSISGWGTKITHGTQHGQSFFLITIFKKGSFISDFSVFLSFSMTVCTASS